MVALRVQRHNSGEDWLAPVATLGIFRHDTWTDFDLLAETEDTSEDGTTSHATLELVDFGTWFVDVERTNNDEPR